MSQPPGALPPSERAAWRAAAWRALARCRLARCRRPAALLAIAACHCRRLPLPPLAIGTACHQDVEEVGALGRLERARCRRTHHACPHRRSPLAHRLEEGAEGDAVGVGEHTPTLQRQVLGLGPPLEVLAAEDGVHKLPRVEGHVEDHRDERAIAQRSARRVTSGKIDARGQLHRKDGRWCSAREWRAAGISGGQRGASSAHRARSAKAPAGSSEQERRGQRRHLVGWLSQLALARSVNCS
jgi:hypothetical protein